MDWITENWLAIAAAIPCLIGIASIIVKVTPTQVDNKILAEIIALFRKLGLYGKEEK